MPHDVQNELNDRCRRKRSPDDQDNRWEKEKPHSLVLNGVSNGFNAFVILLFIEKEGRWLKASSCSKYSFHYRNNIGKVNKKVWIEAKKFSP
jgi:hypothetical protein